MATTRKIKYKTKYLKIEKNIFINKTITQENANIYSNEY